MIQLIGSNYDKQNEIFNFFYYNTDTNWYYEMACRNSFGTMDMSMRTPNMTKEEFLKIAGSRLA
jgi:hypothetical protein